MAMAAALNRLTKSPPSSSSKRFLSTFSATDSIFPARRREESKDRGIQWVFLGCPGVGKGIYARRLSNLFSVPHIATGDLVREELSSSAPSLTENIVHFEHVVDS